MDHTQMVIMWPDEDGNVVRSQRFGWGHEEPSPLLNPKRHAFPKDPVATSVRSRQLFNAIYKAENVSQSSGCRLQILFGWPST